MRLERAPALLLATLAVVLRAGAAHAQGAPVSGGAAPVTLAAPLRGIEGSPFQVRLRVDLRGRTGTCGGATVPLVLGGFSIPVRFDPSMLTFVSASGGSTPPFTATPTFTSPATANANGVVAVAATQSDPASPTGLVDVAVLTFVPAVPGGDATLAPEPGPGALSSAFQGCASGGFAGPVSIPAVGVASVVPIGGSRFHPLTPCRVFDTRTPEDGPALGGNATRAFAVAGKCGVPPDALAVSANLTVTGSAFAGEIRAFPGNLPVPGTSSLSFGAGRTRANNAVLGLATDVSGGIGVHNASAGGVHVILDVNGYFR